METGKKRIRETAGLENGDGAMSHSLAVSLSRWLVGSLARAVKSGSPEAGAHESKERGVTFLWVAVGLFVLAVLLLFAVQPASIVSQRMKEKELLFRGREYTEAVRIYQSEHGGTFPGHLEDLLKPGPKNRRYIRKLWRNPFDKEGKWGLLAPGSTVVTIDDEGKPHFNSQALPAPGQSPTGYPILSQPNQPGQIPGGVGSQPSGTYQQGGKTGTGDQSGSGQQGNNPQQSSYVLPFRLDGQDGEPIVGVYCKFHKQSYAEFYGKHNYDEWYFSPLVIPPLPPVSMGVLSTGQPGQNQQNQPPNANPKPR